MEAAAVGETRREDTARETTEINTPEEKVEARIKVRVYELPDSGAPSF